MGQQGVRVGPFNVEQRGSGVVVRWREVSESPRTRLFAVAAGLGAIGFLAIAVSAVTRDQWSAEVRGPYEPSMVERWSVAGVCLIVAAGLGYLAVLPLALNLVEVSTVELRAVRWGMDRPWRRTVRLSRDDVLDLHVRLRLVPSEGEPARSWRVVAAIRDGSEVVLGTVTDESHAQLLHDQLVRSAPPCPG